MTEQERTQYIRTLTAMRHKLREEAAELRHRASELFARADGIDEALCQLEKTAIECGRHPVAGPLKRFLVFAGEHESAGGWTGLEGNFDEIEEAKRLIERLKAKRVNLDWLHIVDVMRDPPSIIHAEIRIGNRWQEQL